MAGTEHLSLPVVLPAAFQFVVEIYKICHNGGHDSNIRYEIFRMKYPAQIFQYNIQVLYSFKHLLINDGINALTSM